MDSTKWSEVLIEWVNCLKLSQPIDDLKELKNSDFLSNLLNLIDKNGNQDGDILEKICQLITSHYPKYDVISNKLETLSDTELKGLTSLLMHYTCIYDRRDVLTSPLCYSLTPNTQMFIKNFLQRMDTKKIDLKGLNDFIQELLSEMESKEQDKLNKSRQSLTWSSISNETIGESPLQEILQTPAAKKGRMQEKDKEIKRLLFELETERYTKEELQDELKSQIEKNKQTEQLLQQKTLEINRLRNELVILENEAPPHCQDIDIEEKQKLLQCEIQSLQQYVNYCEIDNVKLREERDAGREKIRKLETNCNSWQNKYAVTKTQLESLEEHSKEQEAVLKSLKAHCTELEALLEELRTKNNTIDESFQVFNNINRKSLNYSASASCEDLAHSVVDVQLREAQIKNEELKSALEEIKISSEKANVELSELNDKLKSAEDQNNNLIGENKGLLLKVNDLEASLKLSNSKVDYLTSSVDSQSKEIQKLHDELKSSKDLNKELKKEVETLKKKIHESNKEIADYKKTIQKLEKKYKGYEEDLKQCNKQLKESKDKNNELCKINGEFKNQLDAVKSELSQIKSENTELNNIVEKLKKEYADLDASKKSWKKLVTSLEKKRDDLTLCNEELQRKSLKLEHNLQETSKKLQDAENKVNELQDDLSKILQEKNKLEETNTTVLSDVKNLKEEKRSLEGINQFFAKSIEKLNKEVEQKNNSIANLNKLIMNFEDIVQDLTERNHGLTEVKSELEGNLEKLTRSLDDEQSEKRIISSQLEKLTVQIEYLQKENKSAKQEIEDLTNVLDAKYEETDSKQSKIGSLIESIRDWEVKYEVLEKEFAKLETDYKEIRKENDLFDRKNEMLTEKIIKTQQNNEELNLRCNELSTLNSKLEMELITLKSFKELQNTQIEHSKQENENLLSNFHKIEQENNKLSENIENLQKSLIEHQSTIESLKNSKEDLVTMYERELKDFTNQILLLTTKNNEILDNHKQNLKEMKMLQETLAKVNEKLLITENSVRILEEKNSVVESEFEMKIKAYNDLENKIQHEKLQYENLLKSKEEIVAEKKNVEQLLQKQIDINKNTEKEKKELQNRCSTYEKKIQEIKAQLEQKTSEFVKLIENNQQNKNKESELVQDYEKRLLDYKITLNEYEIKISELKLSEEESNSKYSTLLQELYELKRENECQLTDLTQNLHSVIENYNKLQAENEDMLKNHKESELNLQSTIQTKGNIILTLRKENCDLKEETLAVANELEDIKKHYNVVKNEYENIKRECQEIQQENENIKKEMGEIKKDNEIKTSYENDLLLKLHYLEDEKKLLISKIESLNQSEKDIKETTKLKEELEVLSNKLSHNYAEYEVLQTNYDQIFNENKDLKYELNRMKCNMQEIKDENNNLLQQLELSHLELNKVKRERNEILETQTEIMKATEFNIKAHEKSINEERNEILQKIDILENEKKQLKNEKNMLENDLSAIREAYTHIMSDKGKLELEIVTLRKIIEERNQQMGDFVRLKEQYEKILEENCKIMTEVDTLKYKRQRDREEFGRLLRKEREEGDDKSNKRVASIIADYQAKLDRMKEKMLNLYKEEVQKEVERVKGGKHETAFLQKTIDDLRNELFDAERKIHQLEGEIEVFRHKDSQRNKPLPDLDFRGSLSSLKDDRSSISSLHSIKSVSGRDFPVRSSIASNRQTERRVVTLPRNQGVIYEETTVTKRTSLAPLPGLSHNMPMEDEEDNLFSDKYLNDLKEGRCALPSNQRDSTRYSELAMRNSMVPPHLQSSYPLETQFISPSKFKDEDLKSGNVNMDDSLSKLLPGEKPRQRKDFGTTSYKKPGPPTPSKNGGRLSLQGNEVHPLREHNEGKTPKKAATPSRLKELFRRSNASSKEKENSDTPKTKRLSIFRNRK